MSFTKAFFAENVGVAPRDAKRAAITVGCYIHAHQFNRAIR